MILGIGTDILNTQKLYEGSLSPSDPFLQKTYTEAERAEAAGREDPFSCYATRFAGKEAVFKAFRAHPDAMRLNEIEILGGSNGAPFVNLYGKAKEMAAHMGVAAVHLSLSYDLPYVVAFAVLEGDLFQQEKMERNKA